MTVQTVIFVMQCQVLALGVYSNLANFFYSDKRVEVESSLLHMQLF